MNAYLLIPVVEVVFGLVLLFVLIFSGLRHVARKPFVIFLGFMVLWGFFILLMRASISLEEAFFWEKFVFFAILSAGLSFYIFTISFTASRQSRLTLYALVFFYVLSLALIPTGLIINGMQTLWYGKAPIIGPAFPLYVLCVYVPILLSLVMLIRQYRRTRILNEKVRDSYIIAGIVIMLIGGTTDFLPPLGVNMYPLGIVGNILFCLMATIAMLRYGLLEFNVVLRRGTAFGLVSIFTIGIIAVVIFIIQNMFGTIDFPAIAISVAIVLLAIAPLVQPATSRVQNLVDRVFFGSRYDHMQALERFCKETKDIVDLKDLASSLVNMIANGTQATHVYLLLPSPKTGGFVTYTQYKRNGGEDISFPASSLITQTMKYKDTIIDVNDIDTIPSLRAISHDDLQTLQKNKVELLVPLKAKERFAGMLLLSSKTSSRPYSSDDRRLLHTVSYHAAMALENARLYDELKQQLVSSSKLASLGELAAYVAHEVNNGLQSVINFGTILKEDMQDAEKRADCEALEVEALRARNIVETLLGIARKERVGKSAVDMNDLVRSVVTLADLRAKAAGVTIIEKYSPEPLLVEGSAEQLRQVFLNLFVNATDAMPNGGKIEVVTSASDQGVVVTVTDTGVGIPSHVMDRLFEPLYTTKERGTGLGLAVSRSIARDHGGDITVESEENKGTRFTVTIPKFGPTEGGDHA